MITMDRLTSSSVEINGYYFRLASNGVYFRGCTRCGGTGHYSFNGYDSVCYACNNHPEAKLGVEVGTREDAVKDAAKREKARLARIAKREEKRMVEVRRMEAKQAELKSVAPDVYEFLMAVNLGDNYETETEFYASQDKIEKDNFIRAMAESIRFVTEAKKPFSENMIAATRRAMERRAAKQAEAEAHPAPTGRVVVTGEIVGTKMVEGDYGTAYKITVKDDRGFRVYVSLPKAQADEAIIAFETAHSDENGNYDFYAYGPGCWFLGTDGTDEVGVRGRRITFTATLEQSRDDVSFAFGSRPTKGAWL